MTRSLRNGFLALAVCLTCGLVLVPSAFGVFHLMKVREVATNPAGANSSYIELQMFAAGQNQVGGHVVRSYLPDGSLLGTATIPANVLSGENQRTVLIGDTATPGAPDYVDSVLADYLSTIGAGGAVCFENIDCVSWGGFTGSATPLPTSAGNPAPAIPAGMSLTRSIARGCETLLEAADDTDNSVADFSLASPSPRNNATAPSEKLCDADGTQKCRGKIATLVGTEGKDKLKGTSKRDVVAAGGGNDTVSGLKGNDLICGEGGKDTLKGGAGKDQLVGGKGADLLVGGAKKDTLLGQAGRDVCKGGAADDIAKKCETEKTI